MSLASQFLTTVLWAVATPFCAAAEITLAAPEGRSLDPAHTLALQQVIAPYRAAPATSEAQRGALAEAVLAYYTAAGCPVADVQIESTGDELLVVRITEGRYGRVSVLGGTESMRRAVGRSLGATPGAPLTLQHSLDMLAWLHRNPLHAVTAAYVPGSEPATADMDIQLHSADHVRLSGTWSNDGAAPLSEHRFSLGIEAADLLGLPLWSHTELLSGDDPEAFRGARSTLRWFLPWRHEWRLSGQWTEAEAPGAFPGFTATSYLRSWYVSGRYLVPWSSHGGWQMEAGLGADFFRTTSGVTIDDLRVEATADSLLLTAEAQARRFASTYELGLRTTVSWSPGGLGGYDEDATHAMLRSGASSDYLLGRVQAWWRRSFADGWQLGGQLSGQWTSQPVLPVQGYTPSGSGAVRGFPEASIIGDSGAHISLELKSPAWQAYERHTLQPLAFIDAGWVQNSVTHRDSTLASAGLGLRWQWQRHALLTCDYGWRLTEPGGRVHVSLRFEF